MLHLTKSQLETVNEHKGQLDTDSGQVFDGVAGSRSQDLSDPLYHVEVRFSACQPGVDYERFSFAALEASLKPQAENPKRKPKPKPDEAG